MPGRCGPKPKAIIQGLLHIEPYFAVIGPRPPALPAYFLTRFNMRSGHVSVLIMKNRLIQADFAALLNRASLFRGSVSLLPIISES